MSLSSKALIYKKFELASLIKGYGGPGKAMFVNCEELGILLKGIIKFLKIII